MVNVQESGDWFPLQPALPLPVVLTVVEQEGLREWMGEVVAGEATRAAGQLLEPEYFEGDIGRLLFYTCRRKIYYDSSLLLGINY